METLRVTSDTRASENPSCLKVAVYPGFGGTFKNRYEPLLSVVCVNVTPVAEFESTTSVPGITAPVESITTPVIEELSCAKAAAVTKRTIMIIAILVE
jgi:hypothetical protein